MTEDQRNEAVDFTYPKGFKEASELLTMYPEEQREKMLSAIAGSILFY